VRRRRPLPRCARPHMGERAAVEWPYVSAFGPGPE
jgi:hypothetical protein